MAHFPQPQRDLRAPRVRVPNGEPIVLTAENARMPGLLHSLSVTGGSLTMRRSCASGMLAEIRIDTVAGPMLALVEMLGGDAAASQAFRFVALGDADHQRLCVTLKRLRRQGHGEHGYASSA